MATTPETVGRDEELALVADALQHGRSAVIAGPAGVGKTHLARAVAQQAGAWGWATTWLAATRAGSTVPLGAFSSVLPPGTVEGVSRADMLQRAARVVMGEGAPVLVAVDDAHLLDAASAALVHQLAQSPPATVIVTVRSGETAPDAVTSLWKDGDAVRLDLQPLAEHEAGLLVEGLLGGHVEAATVHRLWTVSDGNALWLRELVLGGVERKTLVRTGGVWSWSGSLLPGARLSELISGRLGDLPPAETATVELLAVADGAAQTVVERALAELEGATHGDVLESLERRGLIRLELDGSRWSVRLSHPLHTETVRAGIPRSRFQRLVQALADALSETGARRRDDVLKFASWALEGGTTLPPDELVAAAALADARFDQSLAVRLLEAAGGRDGSDEVRLRLAHALFAVGRLDEAERLLADLTPDSASSVPVAAERALVRAQFLWYARGRVAEGEAELVAAAELCPVGPEQDELAACRANLLAEAGRVVEAAALADPILARGSELTPLVRARHALVWSLAFAGQADRAEDLAAAGLDDALQLSDPLDFPAAAVLLGLCRAHWIRGELAVAEQIAAEQHRQTVVRSADEVRPLWAVMWARILLAQGRVHDAVRILRESAARLAAHDPHTIRASCLGLLAAALGQSGSSDAAAVARDAGGALGDANRMWQTDVVIGEAWAAVVAAERTRARQMLVEEAERAAGHGLAGFAMLALHDALRLGAPVADRLAAVCADVDGPLALNLPHLGAALAGQDAAGLLSTSAALEQLGSLLWAAEAAAAAAGIHGSEGRKGSAMAAAAQARRLAAQCLGATTPLLAELEEPSALALLTGREREIAELAAQGLTNREVSDRLVISPRTVGNHLYRIYGKLGVTTRDELAAALGGEATTLR